MKERKLEPKTLDTALLEPMQLLRITNWLKHSGKISEFKERLALREAEEREGSRGTPATELLQNMVEKSSETLPEVVEEPSETLPEVVEEPSETLPEVVEDHSETVPKVAEDPSETVPKVVEAEHSQKGEEGKESQEQPQEDIQTVAEAEHSQISEENKNSPEQPPENGQNETASDHPSTDEEKSSTAERDEENIQEHAGPEQLHVDKERRSDTGYDHINMIGYIASSWNIPSSMKVSVTKSKRKKVYQRVENVRLEEYRMTRIPRGKAVIFNIEKFKISPNHPTDLDIRSRTGSSIDADGLMRVFHQLHFEVERFDNISFFEIDGRLRNLAYETDHENVDCVAVFILTHGQNGNLLDATGSPFDLAQLRKYFHASKCVTLAGKPKMFFIQACQGPTPQGSYNTLQKDTVTVKSSPPANSSTQTEGMQSPDEADFLICNSTPPGYVSYRDTNEGSWFISTFIETLEKDRNSFDLLEILARMNHVLGNKTGKIEGIQCAQIASITTTLRKKIFLRTIPPS